jgi:hypothetical protein
MGAHGGAGIARIPEWRRQQWHGEQERPNVTEREKMQQILESS